MRNSKPYIRHVVIAISIAALFVAAWRISDVFPLIFGGLIIAIALDAGAAGLSRLLPLPRLGALAALLVISVAALSILFWLVGGRVMAQLEELRATLPHALATAGQWLDQSSLGPPLHDLYEAVTSDGSPWLQLAGYTATAIGGAASAVMLVALGLYLAVSPAIYVEGFLQLVPLELRTQVRATLKAVHHGLRQWLFGQVLSMATIGSLTAIGLYLIGMPLALTLGLIAGLCAFVPFFGPIASGTLAVLLAFTLGPMQALYVALLCIGIQQAEGFVVSPLIQRLTVKLPPAMGLIAVVAFALLFGIMGVLFATPLMVALMIVVRKLYVEPESGASAAS